MTFCYRDSFSEEIPEAYQRLLLDALRGDRTLFVSAEETELSWKKYAGVLDQGTVSQYERGALPEPVLFKEWIDFAAYRGACE
jgi:glucose-6-phosphate 1-dehydrogenase